MLNAGFRYWFDDDEIAELYKESEDFQVQTAEMKLLLRSFEKPTEVFVKAGFKVDDMFVHYRNFKDLNEYYIHRVHEQQKRQSQKMPQTQTIPIK